MSISHGYVLINSGQSRPEEAGQRHKSKTGVILMVAASSLQVVSVTLRFFSEASGCASSVASICSEHMKSLS